MIVLEARDLGWIKGPEDDPSDQCAHGRVMFQINDTLFLRPEDGVWTVSTAALYLLRTLEHSHVAADPVAESNLLFPCCGHTAWLHDGKFKVICMGCDSGVDPEVINRGDLVTVRTADGSEETVGFEDWEAALFRFADQVQAFFRRCSPKIAPEDEDDRRGWAAFWDEWEARRNRAG